MATLSSAKTIGGAGAILTLLIVVPSVGIFLAIAGYVMILVAVKYISDILGERGIFTNMLVSAVLSIVGVGIGVTIILGAALSIAGLGNLQNLGNQTTLPPSLFAAVGAIIAGLAVLWICLIISSFFLRRSFGAISRRLNVGLFSTAGLLYLIGAALTIIFVGLLLIFVAEILMIVAFFSLPDEVPGSGMAQITPTPTT
jgi:uncharacterized membrane protein